MSTNIRNVVSRNIYVYSQFFIAHIFDVVLLEMIKLRLLGEEAFRDKVLELFGSHGGLSLLRVGQSAFESRLVDSLLQVPIFINVRNYLFELLWLHSFDQGVDHAVEHFVLNTDYSVEENVLLLFLQSGSLSGDLVSQSLALLDWHVVSFCGFELVDDFLYLFLSLLKVDIVSDPLSSTSFELPIVSIGRSSG